MTAVHALATPDTERESAAERAGPIELTVAFTDLADFTTFTEAEGDDAASRLLIGHHRESATIVRSRGGRVLKRLGDGLMLTFPEPEAAVLACLELREAAPLQLRAGIHGGQVLVTGEDVVGHVVNLAARSPGRPYGASWSSRSTCEQRRATCAASPSKARTSAASKASEMPSLCISRRSMPVDRSSHRRAGRTPRHRGRTSMIRPGIDQHRRDGAQPGRTRGAPDKRVRHGRRRAASTASCSWRTLRRD